MVVNIYNDLNRLESTFRQTPEFQKLQMAVNEVKKDEQAIKLFQSFRKIQMSLQDKQMRGEQVSGEEMEYAQKTAQLAQQNPKISALLKAEMELSRVIEEVNRVLMKPIEDLYAGIS